MAIQHKLVVLNVSGPFREPREPVFSYDYSVQRTNWPLPHAVRVKVAIADELEFVKGKLLGTVAGSPGQQLLVGQVLSRKLADEKLKIADAEGLLPEREDTMVPPFTGTHQHLFAKLEAWLGRDGETLRAEVKQRAGV